jgi:hypothetical protein
VERNPLRAGLADKADDGWWGSPWRRDHQPETPWLMKREAWPVDTPTSWMKFIDEPRTFAEEGALAESIKRERPFGSERWVKRSPGSWACNRPFDQGDGHG